MRTASECRQCAAQCRAYLAAGLTDEQRRIVTVIIEIWEALADEREQRPSVDAEPENAHSEQ